MTQSLSSPSSTLPPFLTSFLSFSFLPPLVLPFLLFLSLHLLFRYSLLHAPSVCINQTSTPSSHSLYSPARICVSSPFILFIVCTSPPLSPFPLPPFLSMPLYTPPPSLPPPPHPPPPPPPFSLCLFTPPPPPFPSPFSLCLFASSCFPPFVF